MDALQNDLKIINQCYQHLSKTKQSIDLSYIDAYKYTFSRTGDHYLFNLNNDDGYRLQFDHFIMNKNTITLAH